MMFSKSLTSTCFAVGAYTAKDSPYHDYFRFYPEGSWPNNSAYDGWWGHDTLPKLNYENSQKLCDYILEIASIYSGKLGDDKQIVLSGGTFLNRILLEHAIELLEADGFKVYISEQLPPGDGGICLGQIKAVSLGIND